MDRFSRREFTAIGLAAAALASAPAPAAAQTSEAPISDDLKKLIEAAKQGNVQAGRARMAFKLPEGSETCTVFLPWVPEAK